MRLTFLTLMITAMAPLDGVEGLMSTAFYPALLLILVTASLGIPIPEDVPLIAAGVLMRLHPGIASWTGTIFVAAVGIMSGDLVLYTLGRWWGPGVMNHRYVRRLITPSRFAWLSRKFHEYGMFAVFFGRFFVGIRAAMCMTAGATHYPYPRFFLADLAGAMLSIPFFVFLGWWFAGMIPTLRAYLGGAQLILLGAVILAGVIGILVYRARHRRAQRLERLRSNLPIRQGQVDVSIAQPATPAQPPHPTTETPPQPESNLEQVGCDSPPPRS